MKEVVTIRNKGNPKRVAKPNFWGVYEKKVPTELKDWVYSQYNSTETLFIYCDASASTDTREMAVAISLVQNSFIQVKQKFVYPPKEALHKNIYGELKAVTFALEIFRKYMEENCHTIIIYSDVKDVEKFLDGEISFKKNKALKAVQTEMAVLYKKAKREHPDLHINYLPVNRKVFNPFYRASHNACKRMLHF